MAHAQPLRKWETADGLPSLSFKAYDGTDSDWYFELKQPFPESTTALWGTEIVPFEIFVRRAAVGSGGSLSCFLLHKEADKRKRDPNGARWDLVSASQPSLFNDSPAVYSLRRDAIAKFAADAAELVIAWQHSQLAKQLEEGLVRQLSKASAPDIMRMLKEAGVFDSIVGEYAATCTRQLCVADITHHVLLFGLNG